MQLGFAGIKDEIKTLIRGLEIDANNTIEYSEVTDRWIIIV